MKTKLLCLFLLLAGCVTIQAQSIPEPLLGVSFGKNGLVLSGTDAANHTGKAYNTYHTSNLFDPIKERYYGATNYISPYACWYEYSAYI